MAKAKFSLNSRGKFETKVWDGTYLPDGSKHRLIFWSSKSSADLERKVNEFKHRISTGDQLSPTLYTFGSYAEHWLATKKSAMEINTQNMYKRILDVHLASIFDLPLSSITNSVFQKIINDTIDRPRTCQQIYITFKQIIRMAESDNYITVGQHQQICKDISLPKYIRQEKRPLLDIEKAAIKTAAFSERESAFVYLLLGCGIRRGEALALTKFDFDFSANTVTINKSIVFDENLSIIKNSPKSKNGFRTIPIPDDVIKIIKPYVSSIPTAQLFTKADGGLVTRSAYRRLWASIISKMNTAAGGTDSFPLIADLSAHIFRHNYCTNLCYCVPSISTKKIAQLLGDSERMVLEVYNHIMENKEDVSSVINLALAL